MCDGRRPRPLCVVLVGILGVLAGAGANAQTTTGLGRPASPSEVDAWGVIIGPSGEGLPAGGATAAEGRTVYARRCARCHGVNGNDGPDDRLVGGVGTLAIEQAQKTVGSYWPLATTLWDYVNRAMPFDQPGVLTADEVYASVAYVLFLNEIVDEDQRIDADTLPVVQMPNRGGFVPDPRPDIDPTAARP